MTKIGIIITYHFAENYGSSLQCLALFSEIEELVSTMNVDVEVLDYIAKHQKKNNSLYGHRSSLKGRVIDAVFLPFHYWRRKKQKRFSSFLESRIERSIRLSGLDGLASYIGDSKQDFYSVVSGSDQVWSPLINDFDLAFFFPFKTKARKVGYAISLGHATEADLAPYASYIKDFDAISFRENSANELIQSMGVSTDGVVCDPIFLKRREFWEGLAAQSEIDYSKCKPYIAVYLLDKDNMTEAFRVIDEIANTYKLDIRVINARYTKHTIKKGTILDAGPLEFLNLWKNATFVCTGSFRGTAFALYFRKQFISFNQIDSRDMRKRDLLQAAGLISHSYYYGSDGKPYLDKIDYESDDYVNKLFIEMKESGDSFIKNEILPKE